MRSPSLVCGASTKPSRCCAKSCPWHDASSGKNDVDTLKMRSMHASALYQVADTLDDIREAVATLEELEPTSRRLLGGAHPKTVAIQGVSTKRASHAPLIGRRAGERLKVLRVTQNLARRSPRLPLLRHRTGVAIAVLRRRRGEQVVRGINAGRRRGARPSASCASWSRSASASRCSFRSSQPLAAAARRRCRFARSRSTSSCGWWSVGPRMGWIIDS